MHVFNNDSTRVTKIERLLRVLGDHDWHSTRELVRRVGHAFGVAKFRLVHSYHYDIERRHHPARRFQFQYRLLKDLDE
ncbi:MAG: hypothetical protein WC526_00725 [Patescibacteria group bacterium]